MAAPNLVNVANIYGRTKGVALGAAATDILENPTGSGKVLKVNVLSAANIDGANNAEASVSFVDASASATFRLAFGINVPAKASLAVIQKDMAIYLEEGDKLTGFANAASKVEVTVSYEELS